MTEESLVSVVIPVYNCEADIYRTIDSILRQTYRNIEIIIVNDGSKDGTLSVCKAIEKQYPDNIKVLSQENRGVSAARNKGLYKAKGEYIYFADAGDYAEENMLENYVENMLNRDSDLVVSGYFFDIPVVSDNKISEIESIRNSYINKHYANRSEFLEDFTDLWDSSMLYNVWNKLFKSEIIKRESICFTEGKEFNEDRDFVRDYLRQINSVTVLEECYYHYYRDDASATGIYRKNLFEIRKEEYFILKSYFDEFGVKDTRAQEFLARQHIERVMGCVENLFHDDAKNKKKITKAIKEILNDELTQKTVKLAKPKSLKMQILLLPYKMKSTFAVYQSTHFVFNIKKKYPEIFHRMKQKR